tara:strand:- start:636 stop:944 length:309 start_codon:yes stop_codon:yes gene_type:complete
MEEKNKSQIKIEIDDDISQGQYSNFAIVTHSPAEFIIDFISILPGVKKTKVRSRVVISPMHVKTFMRALDDNIKKYEKKFGEIKVISNAPKFKLPDKNTLPN